MKIQTKVGILALALMVALPLFSGRAEDDNYYLYAQGNYVRPGSTRMEMTGLWGSRESRPFGDQGEEYRIGVSQGLIHRVSLEAWGGVLNDGSENLNAGSGELVFHALDQNQYLMNLNLGVGYVYDYEQESALRLRVGSSRNEGLLNLSSYGLFEVPLEEEDRDEVDVIMGAALSYQPWNHARLGIEVMAEDLEGYWEDEEAEGGAKLLVGPTLWVAVNPDLRVKANVSYLHLLTENRPTRLAFGAGPSDSTGLQCGLSMVYGF